VAGQARPPRNFFLQAKGWRWKPAQSLRPAGSTTSNQASRQAKSADRVRYPLILGHPSFWTSDPRTVFRQASWPTSPPAASPRPTGCDKQPGPGRHPAPFLRAAEAVMAGGQRCQTSRSSPERSLAFSAPNGRRQGTTTLKDAHRLIPPQRRERWKLAGCVPFRRPGRLPAPEHPGDGASRSKQN